MIFIFEIRASMFLLAIKHWLQLLLCGLIIQTLI